MLMARAVAGGRGGVVVGAAGQDVDGHRPGVAGDAVGVDDGVDEAVGARGGRAGGVHDRDAGLGARRACPDRGRALGGRGRHGDGHRVGEVDVIGQDVEASGGTPCRTLNGPSSTASGAAVKVR